VKGARTAPAREGRAREGRAWEGAAKDLGRRNHVLVPLGVVLGPRRDGEVLLAAPATAALAALAARRRRFFGLSALLWRVEGRACLVLVSSISHTGSRKRIAHAGSRKCIECRLAG